MMFVILLLLLFRSISWLTEKNALSLWTDLLRELKIFAQLIVGILLSLFNRVNSKILFILHSQSNEKISTNNFGRISTSLVNLNELNKLIYFSNLLFNIVANLQFFTFQYNSNNIKKQTCNCF